MEKFTTLQSLIEGLGIFSDQHVTVTFTKEGVERRTYADLERDVTALAGGLKANGVAGGHSVALMAANRYEWIATCLGVMRAGAVVVPIDVQLDDKSLSYILNDSGAENIFTTSDQLERLKALDIAEGRIHLLDAGEENSKSWRRLVHKQEMPPAEIKPGDPAVLFYTSGTTGTPKGVPLNHANIAFQLNTLKRTGSILPDDRILLPLPMHHVYPFVVGMLTPLALGLSIVFPQSITGTEIIRALKEGEATVVMGVPRLYQALCDGIMTRLKSRAPVLKSVLLTLISISYVIRRWFGLRAGKILLSALHRNIGPKLRTMASGGAALSPELHLKLESLGWQVGIGYGLTETAPLLTFNLPGQARIGSAGRIVEGVEIRLDPVTSAEDSPSSRREGEILARGPNIFTGYRHLPDETQRVFTEDGWFRTGDLGYFDRDGFLYITGRVSTMIVTPSGKNIQPEDVEEAYTENPLIGEIGILEKEERLAAVIVPDLAVIRSTHTDAETAIRSAVNEQSKKLPTYKRISDYVITKESLPRTRLGKIQRHLLVERYDYCKEEKGGGGVPISVDEMSDRDQALLENPDIKKLWDWLAKRFSHQRLTPDTSPQLDLGIDSLEWVNLTFEIHELLGIELPEEAIIRIDTVRDLLSEVAQQQAKSTKAVSQTAFLQHPEDALSDQQKKWLKPLGPARRGMARFLFVLFWLLVKGFFRLRVKGLDHIPKDISFVVTPNHVSYLDPFVVGIALGFHRLRRTYWAGWAGMAFNTAFKRWGSRHAQVVPIDSERAALSSLAFSACVLKKGNSLVWFPEGKRAPTEELIPFKTGLGILLHHYKVPVVPVIIRGTYEAWPVHQKRPRPYPVTVIFGKPIDALELEQKGEGDLPQDRIMQALYEHMNNFKTTCDAGDG